MITGTRNGQITKKIKPITGDTAHKAYEFVRGFSYDQHPKRTKFKLGTKIVAVTMAATLIGTKLYSRLAREAS